MEADRVLDGRAVVVTGAGRGLGRAYALAAAAAGARVVVNDVDGPEAEAVRDAIVAGGGDALLHVGSVADAAAVETVLDACVDSFGALDGLVNNAALAYDLLPWEEDPAAIRRIVEVNVLGSLLCGTRAIARMRQAGGGVIVNVTSGARFGMPRTGTYGATKGAVASMTYGWALDARSAGVRVNAISPLARTRMTEDAELIDAVAMPAPESVAPAVVFLLSERSAPLTGRILRFDGRALSLLPEPATLGPVREAPTWDVAAIERAVRELT